MQGWKEYLATHKQLVVSPVRSLLQMLLAIFLLSACTTLPSGEPFTFVVPPPQVEIQSPENLLVVREADGNLAILNPAKGSRTQLTSDASPAVMHLQPVWAPETGQLAWVRSEIKGSKFSGKVIVADVTGDIQSQVETRFPPFYMYWNPSGTRLSLLGSWLADGVSTMALNVIDTDSPGVDQTRLLDTGQPFYYAWAPDGERLVVHRDLHTVWVGPANEQRLLTTQAAGFSAPVWLPDSEVVVYGDLRDGVATLVRANLETATEEVLTWYQGAHLALYPNSLGNRLAIIETKDSMAANAFGPLYVHFLDQGTVEQITSLPVMAAFWSPDGAKLLFWEVDVEGKIGSFYLRLWDESEIRELTQVTVTPRFFQRYLVFSDQYALSHSLWSADSRMIAFASRSLKGEDEIYTQDIEADAEPEQVAKGDLVFWSRLSPIE